MHIPHPVRVMVLATLCLMPGELRAQDRVLATVGDQTIVASEVEESLRISLYELEMEKYRLMHRRLQQIIGEDLLSHAAAGTGKSVSGYVTEQIQQELGKVSDDEVNARYRDVREQFPPGAQSTDEQRTKQEIRDRLVRERASEALQTLLMKLSADAKVSILLQPPEPPVLQLPDGNDPTLGPTNAPVTVVEYGDFECPICKESVSVLQQLLKRYPDKVRLVYRNFPLVSHPQARPAAEAAHCAYEQEKFWPYYEALYTEAPNLGSSGYLQLAERLQLNTQEFSACLASDRAKVAVTKDQRDGQRLGLTGTPAFFVNGRYMSGFQPLDTMSEAVERAFQEGSKEQKMQKTEDVRP